MLNNIHIVLSHTSHPGNIGASARALKTMGLSHLVLVNPKEFPAHKAFEMASGATDILENAVVCQSLDEALRDCSLVIGTSARDRSIEWPMVTPEEAAKALVERSSLGKVAMLFGCETFGLQNEELQRCHMHVQIPANPDYSSLNLAAAVQVLSYEIRKHYLLGLDKVKVKSEVEYATDHDLQLFYQHLERILYQVNFISDDHPNRIMQRLRKLFQRAHVEKVEIHILRGMLKEIEKKLT